MEMLKSLFSMNQKELGILGEKLAVEFLREKKYTILRQNFFWDKAEVDIVARQDNLLIFVEVKTRESAYLSDPSLMVPMRKQRQIIKVADAFSKEYEEDLPARFDIISIVTNRVYTKIDHIEDAFYPTV